MFMGDTVTTSVAASPLAPVSAPQSDSLLSSLAALATAVGTTFSVVQQTKAQQKVLDADVALAQAGKPLLPSNLIQATTPTVAVQAGITPQVQQLLIYGGLGLGALILFGTVLKHKRGGAFA